MVAHFKKFLFIYGTIGVIALWASTPFVMQWLVKTCAVNPYEIWGQAGDMFGATTSLFSALTVIGLIITIIRQQDEIKNNEIQFEKQRAQIQNNHDTQLGQLQKHHDEQKDQARNIFDEQKEQIQNNFNQEKEYLKRQIEIQNRERFETSFFNLLQTHNQVYNQVGGYDRFYGMLFGQSTNKLRSTADKGGIMSHYVNELKNQIASETISVINTFETIVKFIMTRKKNPVNQEKYLKIYFSSITTYEKILFLYYYNCDQHSFEYWKTIKFFLFKGIRSNQLLNQRHAHLLDPNVDELYGKIS